MEEGVGMLFECGIASDSAVENPFTGEGELDFEAVEALGYVFAVGGTNDIGFCCFGCSWFMGGGRGNVGCSSADTWCRE